MQQLPAFVIAYSDSSFTNPHEAALPDEPPECTGNFTHMGAKYWGFETARHRATTASSDAYRFDHNAYHWLHLGLKSPAAVQKITISTRWFTGNHVPEVSVELIRGRTTVEVLSRSKLEPDQDHEFLIDATEADECLVRCYHEGGIARVNLFGELLPAVSTPKNLLENATISHVSNEHYGKPGDAVSGNREVDYMLGWESARSGFGEQALFHLAAPSRIHSIVVDTYLHRLNPPLACHVFGTVTDDADAAMLSRPRFSLIFDDGHQVTPEDFAAYMTDKLYLNEAVTDPMQFSVRLTNPAPESWHPLISFGQLRPDAWHHFRELEYHEPITHLLYMHYPNGGIHGLKAFGEI